MLRAVQHEEVVRVDAPAKINVGLRLLGKRADGFHEIESLVMAIDLCDTLEAAPATDGRLSLTVVSDGAEAPADESNLALRAARLLKAESGVGAGARLTLTKRIPAGRGLGGGSSDAAAALVLLSRFWGLDWPVEKLSSLAAQLGSDVPFFLNGPLAMMKGRGEIIEPVTAEARAAVLLLSPPRVLPTKDVYAASRIPSAGRINSSSETWLTHLRSGHLEELGKCLFNDLEPAARALCDDVSRLREALERAGATCVSMTGSGSAVFALVPSRDEARRLMQSLHLDRGVTAYALGPWHP
jgi:4-diphosphocytidyl-2-C-methyl-D-erythritol kinase